MSGTITDIGKAAMAKAISERTLHYAWGTGEEEWDSDPNSKPFWKQRIALVNEVGRRTVTRVGFVLPDPDGDILVPTVQKDGTVQVVPYKMSEPGPTPYLYLQVNFGFEDAANLTIREVGIFMDTVTKEGLPPGQRYFTPGEIEAPGLLLAAECLDMGMNRLPSTQPVFGFILPF
ncbi:hypothetical protein [Oleidesulfovibrio sp.]|uniref:hypothetical protein n=1 Tax=Oleidesulfovibrio sp. TaxID=2909707 RepID=UPI003A8AFEC1